VACKLRWDFGRVAYYLMLPYLVTVARCIGTCTSNLLMFNTINPGMTTASFGCWIHQYIGEKEASIRWALKVNASSKVSSYHETLTAVDITF